MGIYRDLPPLGRRYAQLMVLGLLTGLAAGSFAFAFSYLVSAREMKGTGAPTRQIAVSGEGKVSVRPDIATVRASVITQAATVGDAQNQNSARSGAVMEFLKRQGIEDHDIKTAGYTVVPQYEYDPPCVVPLGRVSSRCPPARPPRISSYEVRNTTEIKVRDLAQVDAVLEGVVTAGANQVDALQFGIDDEEAVKAEARREAIEDAMKKAKILTRDLHIRLKRIISFSESGQGGPIFSYALKGGFGGEQALPSATPQVAPGEQEVRSQVTITYEFR
ncbi:MAG: SIMPL domain-containing protein [Patescibacteria group bacterium]